MNKSKLIFLQTFSWQGLKPRQCILIYDQNVQAKWVRKFPLRYSVRAGENLKDLSQFPKHARQLLQLADGVSDLTIVSLGGGSVGDFAGFFASVLRRGVRLVHIPSTWLAAIDSAHGGKTALNLDSVKNQIGTFYPAEKIILIKDLLEAQPRERLQDAWGEAYKIALIVGGSLWKNLMSENHWKLLPALIEAKYKIVQKDPFEKKGIRSILNLGHTVGHVLESKLKIPHGEAVHMGTLFSLRWSEQLGMLKPGFVDSQNLPVQELRRAFAKVKNPKPLLIKDKKLASQSEIKFVFLAGPGKPVVKKVKIASVLKEIQRQSQL